MIENFNDFISLLALVGIVIAIVVGYIRYQMSLLKKDDDDDYYHEIL